MKVGCSTCSIGMVNGWGKCQKSKAVTPPRGGEEGKVIILYPEWEVCEEKRRERECHDSVAKRKCFHLYLNFEFWWGRGT